MSDKKTQSTTEQLKKNTTIANELAQEQGAENIQAFVANTAANMSSKNDRVALKAQKAAGDLVSELATLILYQNLDAEFDLGVYNWADKFDDEQISAGNSKEFVKNILTGADTFDITKFVPVKLTLPKVKSTLISMYKADGTLASGAYQFKKPLTITREQWLPYFLSGKLEQFISQITSLMSETYKLFKVELFEALLKTKSNFNKSITDSTSANMFECLSNVIFPEISKMRFLNSAYNMTTIAAPIPLSTNKKEDLLLFINAANETKLATGIKSQLFNAQLIDIKEYIPNENIIPVSGAITTGNSDTAISIGADWLTTKQIIVINKNAIRHIFQIDKSESQAWAENLTIQMVLHIWGAIGIVPWGQGFFYECANLDVLP